MVGRGIHKYVHTPQHVIPDTQARGRPARNDDVEWKNEMACKMQKGSTRLAAGG